MDILEQVGEFSIEENQDTVKSAIRILRGIRTENPAANLMDEALKLLTYILF
ncbi:MAG: hypothetical protein F6K22_11320 [Okeania sp. SIO2F4]|uniref:hypothetical protein n=1 Tax=Okeania sp. SIO2F4 TaxID=2607790 RepID=UPI00142B5353|nr:hypothetical protein [Okeania sp. SIO2F4]NES03380.1 hypothetical protein [Okeania sp. SIO2F4]